MRASSQLLDDLVYTRSRNTKLHLIGDYLQTTPDPDRGYGLAALTGTLDIPAVKGAAVRAIAEERVDPVLLYMSRDYVGDMAETVSLLWPKPLSEPPEVDDATISITEAIDTTTPGGRLVFHLFGALGEFERDLIRERTRAGLAAAVARGRKAGRKPVVTSEKLARARTIIAKGLTVREAATRLKVGKTALYDALRG